MKSISMCLMICIFAIAHLGGMVNYHDNFERADGAVGNGWTNIGPSSTSISGGMMRIESSYNQGIKSPVLPTSGACYIQFDWMIEANDWRIDAYPNDAITYILYENDGNLRYDNTVNYSNSHTIQNIGLNVWFTFKIYIDPETDTFSIWIDDSLVADNIAGNPITGVEYWSFRATLGTNAIQWVDNFIVYDDTPPSVPQNLTATGHVNDIELNWTAVEEQEFLTYNIYRDTSSPATTFLASVDGDQTTYTDNTALAGETYHYSVTAVSMDEQESGYSEEDSAHLMPQLDVTPTDINFNVGYGYKDSTNVTISNTGNWPMEWSIPTQYEIPTEGLIAYYPMDGNDQELAVDGSGNGNTGVNHGGYATTNRFGEGVRAAGFNGSNEWIEIDTLCDEVNELEEFTISGWFNCDAGLSALRYFFACNNTSLGNTLLMGVTLDGEIWYWNDGMGDSSLSAGSGYNDQLWHHVLLKTDSQSLSQIYIDGVLMADVSQDDPISWASVGHVSIGQEWDESGPSEFWYGELDDFRMFDRQLSHNEILALYHENGWTGNDRVSTRTTLEDGLVAYFPFDGSPHDVTSNQYEGTIHGGVELAAGVNGLPNTAYNFDGSSGRIDIENLSPVYTTSDSYTWALWAKPESEPDESRTAAIGFERGGEGEITIGGVSASSSDPTMQLSAYGYSRCNDYANHGGGHQLHSEQGFHDNKWHHLVLIRDTGEDEYRFYKDGILMQSMTDNNTTTINVPGQYVSIGCNHHGDSFDFFFDGSIDEVRMYNRPLTPSEIAELADHDAYLSTTPSEGTLQPGESVDVKVLVDAREMAPGEYNNILTVQTDPSVGEELIVVNTTVEAPVAVVDPEEVQIDLNVASQTRDVTLSIGNTGNGRLDFTAEIVAPVELDGCLSLDVTEARIEAGAASVDLVLSIDGSGLADGVYQASVNINTHAPETGETLIIPVTLHVDFNPPAQVTGLTASGIGVNWLDLTWDAAVVSDSVVAYNVYYRREMDVDYRLKEVVEGTTYHDTEFTGLDDCLLYYRIAAVDWVDNVGTQSDSLETGLNIPVSPQNLDVTLVDNDACLTWEPVTQTVSGTPCEVTCYVVYFNNEPGPNEDFCFLSISDSTGFVHENVLNFMLENKMFYEVTAYGGSLRVLRDIVTEHPEVTVRQMKELLENKKRKVQALPARRR